MKLRFLAVASLMLAALAIHPPLQAAKSAELPAGATAKLDFTTLHQVPVYHNGRIMPLQTLARTVSEKVTGREKPRINLERELLHKPLDSTEMATARAVIHGGERKMDATEMLLGWILEPNVWEDIPFILAEHDELRDLLELPHDSEEEKVKLRYVSPAQVAVQLQPGTEFHTFLGDVERKQREARQSQTDVKLTSLETKANQLWERYALYRQVSGSAEQPSFRHGKFITAAGESMDAWGELVETFRGLGSVAGLFGMADEMQEIDEARLKIARLASTGDINVAEMEPLLLTYKEGAEAMAKEFGRQKQRLFEAAPELDGLSEEEANERLAKFKGILTILTSKAQAMAIHANEMHIALYDNDDTIRIAPALNAAALDADRDTTMKAQPWVSLDTVLDGSPELLKVYPRGPVDKTRTAFKELAYAFKNRDNADRAEDFAAAGERFSASLRNLGESLNERRDDLAIKNRDEALMAYTAYPPAGAMVDEVRYNNLDPFLWTWVISLLSLFCFALSFGAARKPMFLAGLAIMCGCILWAIHGFMLRVSVTNWAPVTNMFETVVYVPLFVLVLGLLFLTAPLTWQAMRNAWRLSAIPGSWEASALDKPQTHLMRSETWDIWGFVWILPRVLMMGFLIWLIGFAQVYDGGEVVFHFVPQATMTQMMTSFNHLIVYLVTLVCALGTIWFIPRMVIAFFGTSVFMAFTLGEGKLKVAVNEMLGRKWFALAATGVATFFFLVAWYASSMATVRVLDEDFKPLMPVLRSNFWLTIHVLTIVSSYGAGLLAWGLGVISMAFFLFGKYTAPVTSKLSAAHKAAAVAASPAAPVTRRPPAATSTLASYCYKTMQVAVLLLASGTILGGLWADVSWGRFWGWDPKEVFALVSLLIYLVILHGRYAGWTGNFGTALGTNLGAWAILFSWYGVNFVLGAGLHSYGFGAGGQWEVGLFVLCNMAFVVAASVRYMIEMSRKVPSSLPGDASGPGEDTATATTADMA